jgi:hypothetical protein
MIVIICGAALAAVSSVIYWRLLPQNGQVHPLVEKFDGGSTITLVIMTAFSIGVILLAAGFLG